MEKVQRTCTAGIVFSCGNNLCVKCVAPDSGRESVTFELDLH